MDFSENHKRKLRFEDIASYIDGAPVIDVSRVTEHIKATDENLVHEEVEQAVIRYAVTLGRPMIIGDQGD